MSSEEFLPLATVKYSISHALLSVGIAAAGVSCAAVVQHNGGGCAPMSMLMYVHAAYWTLSLLVDHLLKRTHHKLRVRGYLEFYTRTYSLHRAPIYMVSLWNAVLLVFVAALHHMYGEAAGERCERRGWTSPHAILAGVMCCEAAALALVHAAYSREVMEFNAARRRPDAHDDRLVESRVDPRAPLGRTLTQTADLLARQADLIRHLREHNEKLSTKLNATATELRALRQERSLNKASSS